MAQVTKGEFITNILQSVQEITAFSAWLNSDNATAKAVKMAWDSSDNVILDSPFVQGLITALVPSVLSIEAEGRFNAEIARQTASAPLEPSFHRYDVVLSDPQANINLWLAAKNAGACRIDHKETAGHYRIATTATLGSDNAATVQEVS